MYSRIKARCPSDNSWNRNFSPWPAREKSARSNQRLGPALDLRGARVDEALDALARYLDDAGLASLSKVIIIHGMGTGALRDAVRAAAGTHPLVRAMRAGQRGEGGDGATIVEL